MTDGNGVPDLALVENWLNMAVTFFVSSVCFLSASSSLTTGVSLTPLFFIAALLIASRMRSLKLGVFDEVGDGKPVKDPPEVNTGEMGVVGLWSVFMAGSG